MVSDPYFVFSYGSNLLYNRIKQRVVSVEVVQTHELTGWELVFNKKSVDGSTKANIRRSGDTDRSVWGVIHKIDPFEKPILDQYEYLGKGYNLMDFSLSIDDEIRQIHTYIANNHNYLSQGKPYDWYLSLVVAGARENEFPKEYISMLESIESDRDMNADRREKFEKLIKN